MKKQLIIAALLAIGLGAGAQTKPGWNVTGTISAVDFTKKLPLNTYLGDQSGRQNLNLGVETGYFGEVLGVALTAQSDFDLDSPVLLGAKAFVNLFDVENIVFKGEVGAASFIKDVAGSQWQYKGAVSANVPLVDHFDAKLAIQASTFGGEFKKFYPGVLFGIGYRL